MGEALRREVRSLQANPMDDTVAEAPHASANRLMSQARGAKWPWVASTLVSVDLDMVWSSYKSVLQGPSSRQGWRNKKVPMKRFQNDVCHMAFAHDKVPEISQEEHFDDDIGVPGSSGANAGPGSGHPAGGRGRKRRLAGNDPGEQAEGVKRQDAFLLGRRHAEEVKLMRQYLAIALEAPCFISVPAASEDSGRTEEFFQVLALQSRSVFVRTYEAAEDDKPEQGAYLIFVQPYEQWRPNDELSGAVPGREQDIFDIEEPILVDAIDVCGGMGQRRQFVKWQATTSDVEGCLRLMSPEVLRPKLPLTSPDILVLALVDALKERGCEGVSQRCFHSNADQKTFDARDLPSRRSYLQCVLALPELLSAGVASFVSGQPSAYYVLLLRDKQTIPPNLGAKEYRRRLALAEGSAGSILALEQAAPVAAEGMLPIGAMAAAAIADGAAGESRSSIAGDDDGVGPQRGGQCGLRSIRNG